MKKTIKINRVELKIERSNDSLSIEWEKRGKKQYVSINPTSPDRDLLISDGLKAVFLVDGDMISVVNGAQVKQALKIEETIYTLKELVEIEIEDED